VKALFGDKEVDIEIVEADSEAQDTTEYLMSTEENKRRLLESIEDVKQNRNIVTPDQNLFR
jgi:hypothetical protein